MKKNIKYLIIYACLFICQLIFVADSSAQSETFAKRYSLRGDINLSYERRWYSEGESQSEITHSYMLGLSGYIYDPRLILFDLAGTFTQRIPSLYDSTTMKGIHLTTVFLSSPKIRARGVMKYIPKPITLRYSHYTSEDYTFTGYGFSLVYKRPERFRLFYKGRVLYFLEPYTRRNGADLGGGIPFPTFYLDYDVYNYRTGSSSSESSMLNFRGELVDKNSLHRFSYEHYTQNANNASSKRDRISLDADYKFYNIETKRRFEIYNRAQYDTFNSESILNMSSMGVWAKPIGKYDNIMFSGGINYSKSEEAFYGANISSSYSKRFSQRLTDTFGASVSYGKGGGGSIHSERVLNTLDYDLSRILRLSNGVYLGVTENGAEYGGAISFSTKTRISTTAGYSIDVTNPEEGRRIQHRFSLNAGGPLWRRLSFSSYITYTMSNIPSADNPYSEDTLSTGVNFYYPFIKSSISFGGNYYETSKKDGTVAKTKTTILNALYSRILSRRAMFNVSAIWIKEEPGEKRLELRPRLTWRYRKLFVNVEYDLIKIGENGDTTSHRFFVSVTRTFGITF